MFERLTETARRGIDEGLRDFEEEYEPNPMVLVLMVGMHGVMVGMYLALVGGILSPSISIEKVSFGFIDTTTEILAVLGIVLGFHVVGWLGTVFYADARIQSVVARGGDD